MNIGCIKKITMQEKKIERLTIMTSSYILLITNLIAVAKVSLGSVQQTPQNKEPLTTSKTCLRLTFFSKGISNDIPHCANGVNL